MAPIPPSSAGQGHGAEPGRPPGGNVPGNGPPFAARLKDTVDLNSVRDDLAAVVSHALEPAQVSVWVSERG